MDLPSAHEKFSFRVLVGMGDAEPLSTRAPRMKIYCDLIQQLDSGGASYSQDLSEVDLSDPEDAKVLVNDPSGAVLVHLGTSHFLERYRIYVAHVGEWRQQFQKLDSVYLRYDRQIIVNPENRVIPQKPLSGPALRAAVAAGVKPGAFTNADLKRLSPKTRIAKKSAKRSKVSSRVQRSKHKPAVEPEDTSD